MAKKAKKVVAQKVVETKKEKSNEFDKFTVYPLEEAIEFTKKLSKTKFDASVEIHVRLGIDPKKGDQQIRTAVSLPHGTGKTVRVAAFVSPDKEAEVKAAGADIVGGEELIAEIKKTEKTDFDIAVADGSMMKSLAAIAKILGQRGLMPSPKAGTVGDNISQMVKDLKSGSKIDVKTDDSGNIHQVIGKVSFDEQKLIENFKTLKEAIHRAKPTSVKKEFVASITLSSSMGPGIRVGN